MRCRLVVTLAAAIVATASGTMTARAVGAQAKGPATRMSLPAPSLIPVSPPQAPSPRYGAVATTPPTSAMPPPTPLAVRGTDEALYVRRGSGWQNLGGVLIADPVVVVIPGNATPPAPLDLYIVTGQDNSLWVRTDTAGWRHLSNDLTICLGSPAATVTGPATASILTVGCRGGDQQLYVISAAVDPATIPLLAGWIPMGGILLSGPTAAPLSGAPAVFGVGTDGHLYQRGLTYGWSRLNMACYGHPEAGAAVAAAGVAGSFTLLACHGLDNSVWTNVNTGSGWAGAQTAGGLINEVLAVRSMNSAVAIDAMGSDSAAWEDVYSAGGQSGWITLGGAVTATPESPYVSMAPVYGQTMALDCETAALQMGLAALGNYYSQSALFALESPDLRPASWSGNTLRWGDPYSSFVGNVNGSEANYTGYGIYYPPITAIAHSHGDGNATGAVGWSTLDIYNHLASGRPVQVWVEYRWTRPPLGNWLAWDGRWVRYSTWEHSVLLRGVSDTSVLVNDPTVPYPYWVSRATFEASFADFGNMAVAF